MIEENLKKGKEKTRSRNQILGSGVDYAKGRYQHPYATVVLYGIHFCGSCLKGESLSNVLFTKKKGQEKMTRTDVASTAYVSHLE